MPQKAKASTWRVANDTQLRWLHYLRLYSFSLLVVVLLLIHFAAKAEVVSVKPHGVLAYATSISAADLLSATNQVRATNGLGPLALNATLNGGAQSKANDMIAKDYWAHNAPDGTQPWAFFISAGYAYKSAGENLAYGFDTSSQVVIGWMNSPEHRANVLGNYADVGFGFASGPNYQGGPNTIIVAFYGTPQVAPAAPVTTKPTAAKPSVQKTPVAAPTAPAADPQPTPKPAAQPTKSVTKPVAQPKSPTLPNTNWATYASFGALGLTTAGVATTHWQILRRSWKQRKQFILLHPVVDVAVLAAVGATVVVTLGFIK
ncbi:MAG TPA: CAP domain-containing protein [Candidatus Saccharimonas sp.]|nr:CAP domain-containing protein [Candidatus Saccharimonas sp.]